MTPIYEATRRSLTPLGSARTFDPTDFFARDDEMRECEACDRLGPSWTLNDRGVCDECEVAS